MHAVADVHDTPLNCAPGTSGVDWIDHVLPFHTSVSVGLAVAVTVLPTAMQNEGEAQETPAIVTKRVPGGFGVLRTDHAVPFHRSASVTWAPVRSIRCPTAMQTLAEVHDTDASPPSLTSGFGVGWMAHEDPVRAGPAGAATAPAAGAAKSDRMRAATAAPAASEAANLREACRRAVTGDSALVIWVLPLLPWPPGLWPGLGQRAQTPQRGLVGAYGRAPASRDT